MYRITKEFHFSASHQLSGLPEDHQCARMHGHNYIVMVELAAEALNEYGFVRDYTELRPLKHYIDDEIDHRQQNGKYQRQADHRPQELAGKVEMHGHAAALLRRLAPRLNSPGRAAAANSPVIRTVPNIVGA